MIISYGHVPSPVGDLLVLTGPDGVRGLYFPQHVRGPVLDAQWRHDEDAVHDARVQLGEYFAGRRREFDLPLDPIGTPFQRSVWDELTRIGYGRRSTYGAIAARLGKPTAARAVGPAVGRNPLSIIVPCHRVLGASGALTGFAGGLAAKQYLLDLETAAA